MITIVRLNDYIKKKKFIIKTDKSSQKKIHRNNFKNHYKRNSHCLRL